MGGASPLYMFSRSVYVCICVCLCGTRRLYRKYTSLFPQNVAPMQYVTLRITSRLIKSASLSIISDCKLYKFITDVILVAFGCYEDTTCEIGAFLAPKVFLGFCVLAHNEA